MKRSLFLFILNIFLFTCFSYEIEFKKSFSDISGINTGMVNTPQLNVRSGPSTVYPKIESLDIGDQVTIKRTVNDSWLEIIMEPVKGYIFHEYLDVKAEDTSEILIFDFDTSEVYTDYSAEEKEEFGIVNANSVNIRKEPSETSARVAIVNKKVRLRILSREQDWYYISFLSKRDGFVYAKYISRERKGKITKDFTPVFSDPSGKKILRHISGGLDILIFEKNGSFFKVYIKDIDLIGWIPEESVFE